MREAEKKTVEEVPEGEVAQMLRPYGVGIDTHSKFIAVCVLVRKKEKMFRHEKDFSTGWESLKAAAAWVRSIVPEKDPQLLDYCIESTGCYHMPVLQAFGGRPSVVNPMLAGATHRKTDVLDARMLAQQCMSATWPRSFTPGQQGQELRVLWAQKREAQRFATRCFNRINNIVLRFGHTFGAKFPCRSNEGLAILDQLIAGKVMKHESLKPEALPEPIREVIGKLMKEGELAIKQNKEATVKAREFIEQHDWDTENGPRKGKFLLAAFQTVPGVGETTAITWLAEVIDPRRFINSKQLAAYAGCDPSLKVSAGKVTQHVRRKGNLKLHDAMTQCATAVISRGSSPLAAWGAKIAAKQSKGGFRKAAGAVARRIAVALWHVHRKGEDFSMDGYNFHRETANSVPDKPVERQGKKSFKLDRNVKFAKKTKAKICQPSQEEAKSNKPMKCHKGVYVD